MFAREHAVSKKGQKEYSNKLQVPVFLVCESRAQPSIHVIGYRIILPLKYTVSSRVDEIQV